MARKIVRTLTCDGFSGVVLSAPPFGGMSAEKTRVGGLADNQFTNVVASLPKYKELAITVLWEGGVLPVAGEPAKAWAIETTYSDGGAGVGTTREWERVAAPSKVEPGVVAVDGERRAVVTITLQPQGGDKPGTVGFGAGGGGGGGGNGG